MILQRWCEVPLVTLSDTCNDNHIDHMLNKCFFCYKIKCIHLIQNF